MSNIAECLGCVLENEFDHYLEYVASEFTHLLQDNQDINQCLAIDWIKTNVETVNHIYMRARLAEEELNVYTTTT